MLDVDESGELTIEAGPCCVERSRSFGMLGTVPLTKFLDLRTGSGRTAGFHSFRIHTLKPRVSILGSQKGPNRGITSLAAQLFQ